MATTDSGQWLRKRLKSFVYAFRGIREVVSGEANMQIHLIVAILVVIAGFLFHISIVEWLVCLLCFSVVLTAEMINTAIESVVDLVSPQHTGLARKAKDAAAGAVLVSAIISVIIGLIIFIPKILLVFE